MFVRKIVGLDKEAISKIFSEYLSKYNFNSMQQEFLHQIVDFVLENGDIDVDDLFNEEPFKHQDYIELFGNTDPLYEFVDLFHNSIALTA